MSADSDVGAAGGRATRRPRERIAPIYRRLPSGPNGLKPREIEVHQRARIYGAMVEAVAHDGYDGVTVRQVIGLAGVSRRAFYEHFSNRHDCFLQTAHAIAERELRSAREACVAERGSLQPALTAAFTSIVSGARQHPRAIRLVLGESLAAGDPGAVVLGEVLGACERMLATALVSERRAAPPAASVRALVGGLHGVLAATLRERPAGARAAKALAAEMCALALALRIPGSDRAAETLSTALGDRARRATVAASTRAAAEQEPAHGDARERMLRSAIELAAAQPVASLSAPQIADRAGVALDAALEMFPRRGECLEAALSAAGERLLTCARRAHDAAGDWPQAVRLGLAGVLGHLAANPAQARALALVAHRAGAAARSRGVELDAALGKALTDGGPAGKFDALYATGALWHTVRHALLEQRAGMLAACSDHLAYALLAPAIGADGAIEALRGRC